MQALPPRPLRPYRGPAVRAYALFPEEARNNRQRRLGRSGFHNLGPGRPGGLPEFSDHGT